jgi:hypothetical protein
MEDDVRDIAKTAGCGRRGEAVAEGHSRAHSEAPLLGWTVGMLQHGGGGVREGSPLSLHLSELVVYIRAVN